MKIGKIKNICKKSKRIMLYTDSKGVQWLGDGHSMYPLFDMTELDIDDVFTLFDISEKSQEEYITHIDLSLNIYKEIENRSSSNLGKFENISDITITYDKHILLMLYVNNKIFYIDSNSLKPLDYKVDIYERNGFIIIKCFDATVAIIEPETTLINNFNKELYKIADLTKNMQ